MNEGTIMCSDDEISFVLTGSPGTECFPSIWSLDVSSYGSSKTSPLTGYNDVSDVDKHPISACLPRSECYEFSLTDLSGGIPLMSCDGEYFNREGDFTYAPAYMIHVDGADIESDTGRLARKVVATDYSSTSLRFGDCFGIQPLSEYRLLSGATNSTNNSTYGGTGPYFIVPAFFIVLFVIVFASHRLQKCNGSYGNGQAQVAPGGLQTGQQANEFDAQRQKNREIRAKYIKAHLRTQKVEAKDVASRDEAMEGKAGQLDISTATAAAKRRQRRSEVAASSIHSMELRLSILAGAASVVPPPPVKDSDDVCTICLEGYVKGDVTGRSANPSCVHVFHEECITEWLMKKDDCPNCRVKFLDNSSNV